MQPTALFLKIPSSRNASIEDLSIQSVGTFELLLVHETTHRKANFRNTRASHFQILRRHKTKHNKLEVTPMDSFHTKVNNPSIPD